MVYITYIPNFTEICQVGRMLRWSKQGNFNYNHPVHIDEPLKRDFLIKWTINNKFLFETKFEEVF